MEYLDEQEIEKLKQNHLLLEERNLMYLLKLFKLNKPNEYNMMIKSFSKQEIDYIEELLHKREGLNIVPSSSLNSLNNIIKLKTEKLINTIDPKLLKSFRIILWELQ